LCFRAAASKHLVKESEIASLCVWTNWSREAGGIDKVRLCIGSNTDEGHYGAFILDLDGNNIEAVYHESKTA
jgi:hypothetical protein